MYIIIGLSLIIIIVFLLQDDNYKGCIMYVLCSGLALLFVYVNSCLDAPKYECVRIKRVCNRKMFEYVHTRYICPSGGSYYSVIKSDSLIKSTSKDTCVNCGQIFGKHNYKKLSMN